MTYMVEKTLLNDNVKRRNLCQVYFIEIYCIHSENRKG